MLGILLSILKIIGIILLILIGVVILITCLVLLVPIRYNAQGYYKEDYKIQAKVTWLLHIFSVKISKSSEKPLQILVRILGITIYNNNKPHKTRHKKKRKTSDKEKPELQAASTEQQPESESEPIASCEDDFAQKQNDIHRKENTQIPDEQSTLMQKITQLLQKVVYFLQNIRYTFQKIYDTIIDIKSNICYYCDLLTQDKTKVAFGICQKQLLRIFKNLKPKRWNLHLHIGMEAPAAIGNIMGVWGMLYPFHEGRIALEPDFDQSVIEADFYCKGRITVYVYLWTVYIFLFNKNMKHLRKCLLREEK